MLNLIRINLDANNLYFKETVLVVKTSVTRCQRHLRIAHDQTPGVVSRPVGREAPFLVSPSAERICPYQEVRSERSWLSVRLLTEFLAVRSSCKRDICSAPPSQTDDYNVAPASFVAVTNLKPN